MWVKEADDTLTMLREVKWPLEHLLVSFFHSFGSLIFITSLQLCPHRRPTAHIAPNPLTNPHFNITSFTKAKSRQKSTSPSSAAFNMQDAAIEATERRYYELFHLWECFFNDSVLFPCYFFASFIMLIISSPQDLSTLSHQSKQRGVNLKINLENPASLFIAYCTHTRSDLWPCRKLVIKILLHSTWSPSCPQTSF